MNNQFHFYQDSYLGGYTPPPPPVPPASFVPPPPPPAPSGFNMQQDKASSAAVWALVLGIASWVLCGFLAAIPAWIVGKIEINKINSGRSSQAGKTMATVGMWLGIIQTILGILAIIALIVLLSLGLLSDILKN